MNYSRDILRLAVPSILANITIPLVGIVDVAVAGHLADAAAIGGIAVGTMLFDLLYWNFGFLRVGTSGLTAQAYGRNDRQAQTDLLLQSCSIALAAAAVIWLLQWVFVNAVLAVMPCSAEVADFARRYFYIRIWAAPATLCLFALKGWFIGMQDTVSAMITDIVVNVVNMTASYMLAVYTPLGVIGVAWGTLISQFTGLITACILLRRRYALIDITYRLTERLKCIFSWHKMRGIFTLNSNLFVRSLCFMAIYVGYTVIASRYGDTELAVSAIIMKLFMFFSFFTDGFAYAGEALAGRLGVTPRLADGSGTQTTDAVWHKTKEVSDVVKTLFVWTFAIGIVFSAGYFFASDILVRIMTDNADVLTAYGLYIVWIGLMPVISSLAFMWDGIYIGATAAVPVRNSMIWSAAAFMATYWAISPFGGVQALYAAYFAHLLVRTFYLSVYWRKM